VTDIVGLKYARKKKKKKKKDMTHNRIVFVIGPCLEIKHLFAATILRQLDREISP
jgi:hypothetical protein